MARFGTVGLVLGLLMLALTACGDDEAFQCGDELTCRAGQVCVESAAWTVQYRCADNPCSGELSCDCAKAACDGMSCGGTEDRTVSCVCLTC
jgi:hypothetical protein